VLWATSHLEFGGGTLRSTVFLERRLRLHVVQRDRLLFDSAFAPPARTSSAFVHLFVQLSGTFVIAGRPPLHAPCAFVLDESEFDRVMPGSLTFRSFGARCTIVELRMPSSDVRRPIGLGHGAIDLDPSVWDAYRALAAEPNEQGAHRLLAALSATGVVSPELAASVMTHEPERFQRVWAVLRPLYGKVEVSAGFKDIQPLARLSTRQLSRDLTDLIGTFGLFGGGFREVMRVIRLRAAVLLLSAPDATPSAVSRLVGYGSLDAMGRAFRDAKLRAPSLVQSEIRFREAP